MEAGGIIVGLNNMFEINRPDKDSGIGIYAKSVPVKPKQHIQLAADLKAWMNETNGSFKGEYPKAFAIAHCQVANVEEPLKIFVVDSDMVAKSDTPKSGKMSLESVFFEDQVIFNAEVLEAPEKVKKQVPKREIKKDDKGKAEVEITMVEKELSNVIEVPEGCMSFPHRKQKNKKRFHTVKVKYQYVKKTMLGNQVKTITQWVTGLKSHIFQHECEHFEGKNMFYD